MFCKNCGTRINGDNLFCGNCGYNFNVVQNEVLNTPSKVRAKKKIIIAVFSMLAVVISIVIFINLNSGFSGTFESECGRYSISFRRSGEVTWFQGGTIFTGTYRQENGELHLFIRGQGMYMSTNFIAIKAEQDLLLTGGDFRSVRFIRI